MESFELPVRLLPIVTSCRVVRWTNIVAFKESAGCKRPQLLRVEAMNESLTSLLATYLLSLIFLRNTAQVLHK